MLHTVNKSPFERNALDACLKRAVKGSAILLFEDGVYAALAGTSVSERVAAAAKDHEVYALSNDLQARGLKDSALVEGIKTVDYAGFVELVARMGSPVAWL